ncbi:MAG: hypothetical protein QXI23_02125 [Candidatus Aenigmatarchaeota archaeon]
MKVLERLCELLGRKVEWMVVGSASLALQGVEIEPKDIDILTTKEGAYKISSILKEYEVKPVKFSKSRVFSSHFGKFRVEGIDVEVMGDLKAKVYGRWVSLTWRLKRPVFVKIGKLGIPVSRLEDQLKVYSMINRKKNLERV